MDTKLKAAVLLVLIGGGAFMGWRFLQDKAAAASDDDLISNYSLAIGADATSPYNKEAQKRVESGAIKYTWLENKATDRDEKVRQVAFNLMAYIPKANREAAVHFIENVWYKNSTPEVREQMIYALKECALNGMGDKGKGVIKFLCISSTDPGKGGVSPETEKLIAKACKELAEQSGDDKAAGHSRKDWQEWYVARGSARMIPDEVSNKRGRNK